MVLDRINKINEIMKAEGSKKILGWSFLNLINHLNPI
jgi:hypothetical protein